ncbi:MAG: 3-phosphoshikimate 1-carboxyvinyltransferase [Methanomassiliicoccaceae archaeon]|jgi:3-phosphoshikimate 1-carboxyvinyltransferase|nr:3-phosphoshikimate 1-carboxyvinyltransferase [Methanomassiliicoccaceae archaeon]
MTKDIIRFSGGGVIGEIIPPPSKSHTHRAFLLSALSSTESKITNALDSQDTRATLKIAEVIGADVRRTYGNIVIRNERLQAPEDIVDAENSGTTMRLFAGIASMFDSPVTITGDASLRSRPMGPLLDALSSMNVKCTSNGGKAPVTICGPNNGGNVVIPGNISSQFISSLMMVAPMLQNDSEIHITGDLSSRPYVNITADIMERLGADVMIEGSDIRVKGRTGYEGCDICVPSDMSSAAFPLVAGALGGSVTVKNMDMNDPQGDKMIIDILRNAGANVSVNGDKITSSSDILNGMDVNMSDVPDLFPIVAVLLSTAKGRSRLYGAPQLRFKESDRIMATVNMLSALGADITGTDDGCVINGVKRLKGGRIEHHEDHRILMAAAVASLVCDNDVTMVKSNCYDVSYPLFIEHMNELGMLTEV